MYNEILSLESAMSIYDIMLILKKGFLKESFGLFCLGDNNLQLDGEICLSSKKKSPSKKITGLQVALSTYVLIHT